MSLQAAVTKFPSLERRPVGPPLCVDLDGTLIRTDMLFESLLRAVKEHWWTVLLVPFWALRGRAYLKHRLAQMAEINPALLPYRENLLDWLWDEYSADRRIVLATGSDRRWADAVSRHLGIFDEVVASTDGHNLTGRAKAKSLVERFGEGGFDYVGDSRADQPVWRSARYSIAAGEACSGQGFKLSFPNATSGLMAAVRALRPKHWAKNLLVFLPLLASHRIFDGALLLRAVLMFAAFSATASAVYLVNDLLDLESDRQHPVKRRRPFASGDLSLQWGLIAAPLLFILGFALAAPLGAGCVAILATYLFLSTLYSVYLKRKLLVDVFTLAILYTLRTIAGGAATGVLCSVWLLAFCVFQFLSLAFLKRSAELKRLTRQSKTESTGRGYFSWDLMQVNTFGVSAGYVASLILGMYIGGDSVRVLYRQPAWLWVIVPLHLYWNVRVWLLSHRGAMDEDPIVFAASDRVTWICAAIGFVALAAATFGGFTLPGIAQ